MLNNRISTVITVITLLMVALFGQVFIAAQPAVVFAKSGDASDFALNKARTPTRKPNTPTKTAVFTRTKTRTATVTLDPCLPKPTPTLCFDCRMQIVSTPTCPPTVTATATTTATQTATVTETPTLTLTPIVIPTEEITPTRTKTSTPTQLCFDC